jgi:uncharacterized membrane protein
MKKRFWEIDFFRGIAIILMIIFHLLWNLDHFNYIELDFSKGFMNIFRIIIACMFLGIVGIAISVNKKKKYSKVILQGLKVFGGGMLITIITFFVFNDFYVRFGILHLIGLGIIIVYPISKLNKYLSLGLGLICLGLGSWLSNINASNNYFLVLGLNNEYLRTLDYYPLFPWLGVILVGVFIGKIFYVKQKRNFKICDFQEKKVIKLVSFLGRHSLVIYLLHQVFLFGGFWVFN